MNLVTILKKKQINFFQFENNLHHLIIPYMWKTVIQLSVNKSFEEEMFLNFPSAKLCIFLKDKKWKRAVT